MKKILTMLLLSTVLILSGCGKNSDSNGKNVELTIPATYVGEQTQKDLDEIRESEGYKSITLNEDGTATYVMTKKQHESMMTELATTINDAMGEMVGSEDYPNITEVKANDTYTEFTVTTKSTELDMGESFTYIMFFMYGGMYQIFNGSDSDNVIVNYINADSGETISSTNSGDIAK